MGLFAAPLGRHAPGPLRGHPLHASNASNASNPTKPALATPTPKKYPNNINNLASPLKTAASLSRLTP